QEPATSASSPLSLHDALPIYLALVEIEKRAPEFLLVTQNVDGLHQRAGSKQMVELHGNIHRFRCFENDCPSDKFDVENGRCRSRSEEHTSELQSLRHLVCRLL